jgi:signal transduction histidine kinase
VSPLDEVAPLCSIMPTLSSFIRQHRSQILTEWVTFARALPLGAAMSIDKLRDHAEAMLDVIALDLETPQTATEQSDKSKGLGADRRSPATAAAEHGSERAEVGFTVIQMIAEFRALRASVVRLWTSSMARDGQFDVTELNDLIRFNEAIDQAIAESLMRYTHDIDETRERFLAILGHDLRNPLGAIETSASFLLDVGGLTPEQQTLVQGIESAGERMARLIADLLDLALSRLGDSLPVKRAPFDLATIIRDVVAEIEASYPLATVQCRLNGDLTGDWDEARLAQALTNLLGNAVQHGDATAPIAITAEGTGDAVTITVHNQGPAIAPERLRHLFDGMTGQASEHRDRRHLGLGLYIVDKIVEGHGGTIDVQSAADSGTTFIVHLPRSAPGLHSVRATEPGTAP